MRVDEASHQFIVPLRRLPVRPVVRQFHDRTESACAIQQVLDVGDRVVRGADAAGTGFHEERVGVLDVGRHDREGPHVGEVVAECVDPEPHILACLLACLGDMDQRDQPPLVTVRHVSVETRLLFVQAPVQLCFAIASGLVPPIDSMPMP